MRRGQEADAALRRAMEAASTSGAHEPLKSEIQRRKDDAGAEALADARQACEALEAVARQAKVERSLVRVRGSKPTLTVTLTLTLPLALTLRLPLTLPLTLTLSDPNPSP